MPRQIQGSQWNFSFGEVDVALKRADDHPARKAGLRQMSNARILNARGIQNRPGRSALFPAPNSSRIEEVTMSPGNTFKLVFGFRGNGQITIVNSAGAAVLTIGTQGSGALLPWTLANIGQIVFAQLRLSIYITFPGMRPQVLSWDGITTGIAPAFTGWTIADYTELTVGSQKRTWFYRISPQGIALLPGAQTGSTTLVSSDPLFTAGHVGTRMRFVNRQILITAVADAKNATILIEESLPGSQNITFTVDPTATYGIGDVVIGSVSGSKGIVTGINAGSHAIGIQLISTNATLVYTNYFQQQLVAFVVNETVAGPGGGLICNGAGAIAAPALGVTFWDEEVMNPLQGYPASCFVDQFRIGFCNFPTVPNAIGWSAINSPTDLYVGGPTVPNGAIFEVAPDKAQVLYVVPGPESSEFVFCDHKIYYIKIDATNPLRPGSVGFQTLSGDGAARVQPRISQDFIFYVNAGGNSVMAVIAPGAYYRPFNTKNLCDFHSHLFNNITALAAPNADGSFNERYLYALNADGSMACCKYNAKDGQIGDEIGWGPWSGAGSVAWVAATNADVLFTTSYFGATICEILDDTKYLDASLLVNALPAPFAAPAGRGPLWFIPLQTVTLMDQVTRNMGTYVIDANGFIVPQFNGGEDLTLASLVAGQPWTATVEPFAPDAQPGADMGQRMKKRQFGGEGVAIYFLNSTGFLIASLFSGKQTPTSPALGAIQQFRRIPAYNAGEDATKPPPLREWVESWVPPGSSFDPRVAIIKDTPGPLLIAEIGMEI